MKDKERDRARKERGTARHEAGHAVMSIYLRRAIEYVEITPNADDHAGLCSHTSIRIDEYEDPLFPWKMEREALILLAGHAAKVRMKEEQYRDWRKHGAEPDIDTMTTIAFKLNGGGEAVGKYIDYLWQKVSDILSTPLAQKQIEAVTDALIKKRRLSGRAVRQIVKSVS